MNDTLLFHGRAVEDVVSLNFSQFKEKDIWVVATIQPQPGFGWIPGQYAQEGKIYTPANPTFMGLIYGAFRIVSTLTGVAPDFAHYDWKASVLERRGMPSPPAGFWEYRWNRVANDPENNRQSPFRGRVRTKIVETAIFKINPDQEGAAKFRPIYLIPSTWGESALPALKYFEPNPQLFQPELAAANRAALEKLLSDENPFIAIAAARVLGQVRALDADFVRGPLAQARSFRQAVFLYLLFKKALPERRRDLIEEIEKIVDAAANSDALQGLALGAYMVTIQSPTLEERHENMKMLKRIDARQAALNTQTAADDYIVAILERTGLRKQPSQPAQVTVLK